jgi:hypothetical protein
MSRQHSVRRIVVGVLATTAVATAVACSDVLTHPPTDLRAETMATGVMLSSIILETPGGPLALSSGPHEVAAFQDKSGRAQVLVSPLADPTAYSPARLAQRSVVDSRPRSTAQSSPKLSARKYASSKMTTADGRKHVFVYIADPDNSQDRPPSKIFHFVNGKAQTAKEFHYKRQAGAWVVFAGRIVTFDANGKQTSQVTFKIDGRNVALNRAQELRLQLRDALAAIGPRDAFAREEEAGGCRDALTLAAQYDGELASLGMQLASASNDCAAGDSTACVQIVGLSEAIMELTPAAAAASYAAWRACMPRWLGGSGGSRQEGEEVCIDYYEGWYYPETGEIEITAEWTECYET